MSGTVAEMVARMHVTRGELARAGAFYQALVPRVIDALAGAPAGSGA